MLRALASIVGEEHVLTDPDLIAGYVTDWTGEFTGTTPAVVRPGTSEQACAVMAVCHEAGMPVVVQGGNTGLVGGSVPRDHELVISTRRLDEVAESPEGTIRIGAGATLTRVHDAAAERSLSVGIDTSARDSASIGGMVATNGGGVHTIRCGRMRDLTVDVEACLADGTHVGSVLLPGNPAADLWRVICGSEGTLAVLLGVTVRTEKPGTERLVILIPSTHAEVTDLARRLVVIPSLWALEVLGKDELELVQQAFGHSSPISGESLLLVEFRGPPGLADLLTDALGDIDGVVASHPSEQEALWEIRHSMTHAAHAMSTNVTKLDVTVPLDALGDLRLAMSAGPPAYAWGHVFTGPPGGPFVNLHVNVAGAVDRDTAFDVVERLGGSAIGEHGVGVIKRHRLDPTKPDVAELIVLKERFDPSGLLNPGALLPESEAPRRGHSPQQVGGDRSR